MSIKRFNGAGISGTKSIKVWDQTTTQNDYQSIATVIVPSGGQSNITFTNIPQNFTHLQLRMICQFSSVGDIDMQFNGDSTSGTYSYHLFYGQGSSAVANATANTNYGAYIGYGAVGTNVFFGAVVDIFDYTNTNKFKVARSLQGVDTNGSGGFAMLNSGMWSKAGTGANNSDPITSIKVYSKDAVNFQQFSQIALYGIKVAS